MTAKTRRDPPTAATRAAQELDLGGGSSISYLPGHFAADQADEWFKALDSSLPWERPEIFVRGRRSLQPRETFYIADPGLKPLKYSGHAPAYHIWDDFPVLQAIRDAVCEAVPGYAFNSCLINRYADGDSSVAWHSDAEKLFGIAPTIASLSLGTSRDFLVRRKVRSKRASAEVDSAHGTKRTKREKVSAVDVISSRGETQDEKELGEETSKFSFYLGNGDVLLMRGNMQRDWEHAVPKRKAVKGTRLSLTFRTVLEPS
ncbi:2-oxoglutarate (2OG) and Fe(II)-dependent oxygenase superfamily protein [Klebsormidium nitens]|uniref:2-oxoglutarate (2OG) and Fe(II)-dependent oxygenase superfamily protein n=1 Tax=Klebsormidium nitens TaxID=105231 RepID=A0A1Y1IPD7_KLENI|nr:2-oxoglutarate (2OG) and Fe(II)-dependent oxygenase superfamily protein [Klebsormidium nitens]|eukprot:GAQ90477.1 2-oxoglutarate (2OG) and Fe(II)-dependent oxygenase superfamily protein [Klebsormidium nitens]